MNIFFIWCFLLVGRLNADFEVPGPTLGGMVILPKLVDYKEALAGCKTMKMRMAKLSYDDGIAIANVLNKMKIPLTPGLSGVGIWIDEYSGLKSPSPNNPKAGFKICFKVFSESLLFPSISPMEMKQLALCEK